MTARREFYRYDNSKRDATKKHKEVADLVEQAEALLLKAEKIARKEKMPFCYSIATTDAINDMAQSPDWVNSTCSGGSDGENWKHIPGTPKEKEIERSDEGYPIDPEEDGPSGY